VSILKKAYAKRPYFLTALRISLALFLTLSSAAILYTTARNQRAAVSLAEQSLENTALALSSSAESALRTLASKASQEIREIFSDRVVAYALIVGRDGKILFHTNPRLVGSYISEEESNPEWPSKPASGRRITLRTGLPAYEFNYILHRGNGTEELLRLVLHTTPADHIVSGARQMWWTVGGVLILLWTVGIALERIFTRHLRLQEELERRQQLVLIGQMTAVLAHEIRNALGGIKGYAQWVEEKIEAPDPKKAGLSAVLRGAERIEALVNDLLLFSRKEVYHLERVDLHHLVQETINSALPAWKGKVELEMDSQMGVMADREKLHRVLINGLRNAIQSMGEEGILGFSVHPDGRWVRIQIADNGPGIPEEEIGRLFTPFHTTKTDGTGLGLAYSKKVIEGMGGRIQLSNREGRRGAILTIQLPKTGEDKNG
jgi:two-component system sensor histidine kinase HydH